MYSTSTHFPHWSKRQNVPLQYNIMRTTKSFGKYAQVGPCEATSVELVESDSSLNLFAAVIDHYSKIKNGIGMIK